MELHGGNIYDKSVNLDFSISVNPFGLPEKVRKEAFRGVEMAEHYPDSFAKVHQRIFWNNRK